MMATNWIHIDIAEDGQCWGKNSIQQEMMMVIRLIILWW